MHLTYRVQQSNYSSRLEVLNSITSAQNLLISYVDLEPHSLLHAGFLCDAIQKLHLTHGSTILELGMDPLKDFLIANICGVSIKCYDVDCESVNAGNSLMRRIFGPNPPVKYVCGDFLKQDSPRGLFSLALLSQMDYVLGNQYLKSFSKKLSFDFVDNILIASPSTFRWYSKSPSVIAYNLELLLKTSLNIIKRASPRKEMLWHIRSIGEINRIFSAEYTLSSSSYYRQLYAITNLLTLRRNTSLT